MGSAGPFVQGEKGRDPYLHHPITGLFLRAGAARDHSSHI